jgi:TP901 family phage tail tape measure protein
VSIEETAGTIALLAKNGIIGEKAGTGLRGILSSLTSPSAGLEARNEAPTTSSVFDAQGNFIGLAGTSPASCTSGCPG